MSRRFERQPLGWRYTFGGINTKDAADALSPNKYPYAQNIRPTADHDVRARPGSTLLFSTAAQKITDIRAYTKLNTDAAPRYLARNSVDQIYLDSGALVGTMAATGKAGVFMIPYRPNQSPSPWMYIASPDDYQKFSTPGAPPGTGITVTQAKVGIREPGPLTAGGNCIDTSPSSLNYYSFSALAASWTNGGTAGAVTNATRVADTAVTTIVDPASSNHRWSVQVATNRSYQIGELLNIVKSTGGSFDTIVQDVIPPINAGVALTVQSIFYYSGTTGRCVIVPTQFAADPSVPSFVGNIPSAASIYSKEALSSLRRGALVRLNAAETVFVLSVTTGPNGMICFEVSTTGTIAAGQSITGIPTIIVGDVDATIIGQAITAVEIDSTFTGSGEGTFTQALATNPFTQPLAPSINTAQADDYVCFNVNMDTVAKLVQGVLIFDIRNGAADYTTDTLYYIFNIANIILPSSSPVTVPTPSDAVVDNPDLLANYDLGENFDVAITRSGLRTSGSDASIVTSTTLGDNTVGSTTPLPTGNWATVLIPIRGLRRNGNDLTRSLINCQGVRVSLTLTQTAAATNVVRLSSFWVGGGGQPDVASNAPYFYAVRGRDSHTGARGNSTAITRHGVSPRRQQVLVQITDTSGDTQIDTWDVFRFGGTVNSWRYIGSVINTAASVTFTDNFFDTAAIGGELLETDNFEPWPSIDEPFTAIAGTVGGVTTTIQIRGTAALVIYSAAAPFTNPAPSRITSWLPGTLVVLGGQEAYTLWARPRAVTLAAPPAADYFAYLFEFVENAGSASANWFVINEPFVANQHLPYLFGPDAQGTIFACGDVLRPGTFYYCNRFNPDSASDSNNQELTAPTEPLLGGEIIDGIALIATSRRWWILYPSYGTTPTSRYTPVEAPVGAGLAAPYAHDTDGKFVYFVGKDGIYRTSRGEGMSLTDADLFNLFPHDSIPGSNVTYGSFTVYAPNYSVAATFRLKVCNHNLYFDYQDSTGVQRTLVCFGCDTDTPAWSVDNDSGNVVTCHYAVEQPEGSLLTSGTLYPLLTLGTFNGHVLKATDNTNDFVGLGASEAAINCAISTLEFNSGDLRENQLWLDIFLDSKPLSAITAQPMSNRAATGTALVIPAGASRVQSVIPIAAELNFLGLLSTWTDNFNLISTPTTLFSWQPLYQAVPIAIKRWKSQGTSFGLKAYSHIRQITVAYKSTAAVTLTVTVYDGTAPDVITLPSTGGALRKITFPVTFNKGMLYFFDAVTADGSVWTPYFSEWEIYVGEWGRADQYVIFRDIAGPFGISAAAS